MITITWQDGTSQSAPTWRGLLEELQKDPWNKDMPMWELKKELGRRAAAVGVVIRTQHVRDLFNDLEAAGLITVVRT